jgi:hypothetical protein
MNYFMAAFAVFGLFCLITFSVMLGTWLKAEIDYLIARMRQQRGCAKWQQRHQ